jgi:hypothetical protein
LAGPNSVLPNEPCIDCVIRQIKAYVGIISEQSKSVVQKKHTSFQTHLKLYQKHIEHTGSRGQQVYRKAIQDIVRKNGS